MTHVRNLGRGLCLTAALCGGACIIWGTAEPAPAPSAPRVTTTTTLPPTESRWSAQPQAPTLTMDRATMLAHADELGLERWVDCKREGDRLVCGDCSTNAECGDGKACAVDWRTRRRRCVESTCREDADCAAGERCIPVTSGEEGVGVTGCFPIGMRAEGEECGGARRRVESDCGDGLVCVAGLCRPGCSWPTGECPAGSRCALTYDGPACERVSCEGVTCSDGATCLLGRCVRGVDCTRPDACPAGQVCSVSGYASRWTGTCYPRCETSEDCAHGGVCDDGRCFARCDPEDFESCPKGEHCGSVDEARSQWTCRVD